MNQNNLRLFSIRLSLILLSFIFLFVSCGQIHFLKPQKEETNSNSILQIEGSAEKRSRYEFTGKEIVIATDHPLASQAGINIWKKGGNVVDVFVAASFAISVLRPHSTGLLGGGFAVINIDEGKTRKAFDFRERASEKVNAKLYVDEKGVPIKDKTIHGPFSAGVPGMIPGLLYIHKKYGKLSLADVTEPALDICSKGFSVYSDLAKSIESNWNYMNPEMIQIFGKEGRPLRTGEILIQNDVSQLLKRMVQNGEAEIRTGESAVRIAEYYSKYDQFISLEDLKKYKVKESEPIQGVAFGKKVITMPPPSSGVHLITIMRVLKELMDKKSFPEGQVGEIMRLTESMRVGFRDRAKLGGDPEFTKIDVNNLLSIPYAKDEAEEIERKVVSGAWTYNDSNLKKESYNTTHISVMDFLGNGVSSTQSINGSLGAKIVVPGTGLILNNTMDDFAVAPGIPNIYGLVGSEANSIQAGKTPLSSMSPMIFLDEFGKSEIIIGAPGGSQIPTTILNTLYYYKVKGLSLYESASYPRLHHQFMPDVLFVEPEAKPTFPESTLTFYKVQYMRHRAKVFVVAREGKDLIGVSDPRGEGIPLGY
ncbi:MAG: gamma-glutamyltransferase [Leptospira sp.]|nr:gamma-glutamyltransferase [Leptospira sp.]